MADDIIFEMQVEIMKRLPVKSLAVFRSVSKAWKSTIDSPVFMAGYTNMHQQHRLLIKYEVNFYPSRDCFDVYYGSMLDNDNDTLSRHEFDAVSKVPVRQVNKPVGMSQGLLCLFDNSLAVILNPALGKSIAIHLPCLGTTVLGFGVRPDNYDPMIVMVSYVLHPIPVLVFTLSSRAWRAPRGNLFPKSIDFACSSPVVTVDRCIYWKASERSINLVVAFDMVSEDFTAINLPHSVAHRAHQDYFSISKIKESLALVDYDDEDDVGKRVYSVWMMVEDGVSKAFTKLFTINPSYTSFETSVLGFRKNGQPIMEISTDEDYLAASLVVYKPRTGTIKNVGIDGERNSLFVSSYTESILLLDQLDKQHIPKRYMGRLPGSDQFILFA